MYSVVIWKVELTKILVYRLYLTGLMYSGELPLLMYSGELPLLVRSTGKQI